MDHANLESCRKGTQMFSINYQSQSPVYRQLYDQIIINGNICRGKGLKYAKSEIYSPTHLINKSGRYKGYPKRTHANGEWLNGYSDHLPVLIYMKK